MHDRQLDEQIARRVFGGPFERVEWWWWSTADWPMGPLYKKDEIPESAKPLLYAGPHFSTRIEAAWLIVEHLRDLWTEYTDRQGDRPSMLWDPAPFDDGAFFEQLHRKADRRWPWAFLYATPGAICRAALTAFHGDEND